MLLKTGHRGCSVIKDYHHVPAGRRIIDHLDESGDSAVHERAVANDADDLSGLFLVKRMPHAHTYADAGAHADTGVHRVEWRQNAKSVTPDVTGNDATEIPQRFERH